MTEPQFHNAVGWKVVVVVQENKSYWGAKDVYGTLWVWDPIHWGIYKNGWRLAEDEFDAEVKEIRKNAGL
jgi:hypothetical protein